MTRGRVAGACLAALFTLLCVAGCGDEEPEEQWLAVDSASGQGDVALYRDVQFRDVPIPQEYYLLPDESFSFQGSLFRNAIIKYQGPLEWTEALLFFRRELPAAGWRLDKTEKGHDLRVLYFSKDQEKLIVVVRQARNGSRAELQLDNVGKSDLLLKGKLKEPKY